MNYLSIPHYRGTKEKYDKSKHADGIFFTTDTHEIIANDTAYNELIKEWTISNGTLTIRMTSGKTYEFNFPNASETERGLMSKEDKKKLDNHLIDTNNPHQVTKAQVGLSNVDNTSDKLKPISDATKTALDGKVDKVTGKSLVNDDQINKLSSLKTQDVLNADIADAKKAGIDAKTQITAHEGRTDNPHNVNKNQIGLSNVTNDLQVKRAEMGVANGVATLDDTGTVPSSQLPSYVDEILEFQEKDSFPETGESGKIYVELTSNLTYRWSGTQYVEISPSIGLGETSSTAYAGDKGAAVTAKLKDLAQKRISYIDSENAFTSDETNVALNYIYFSGDDNWLEDVQESPKIPVVSSRSAGILTSSDYSAFKQCTVLATELSNNVQQSLEDIKNLKSANETINSTLSNKVDKVTGKQLSSNDFTNELKQTLEDLNSWNYIGILSSWNGIAKLTTESTEADILTALTITPLRGNKINTKTELFKVLDQCAINKKFLKESSTNANVFVNHIGSCYVIYILGNKPSVLNGKLVGTSVLRSITITANSNETLAVLKNPLEINLEDINSLKQRVVDLENKVQQLINQLTIE